MEFTLRFAYLFGTIAQLAAPILIFFFCVIVGLGQVVGRLEKWTPFDALYWSFITATTVGYGDMRPQTKSARCLSILIAMAGLIFTGLIIAIALQSATMTFSFGPEFDLLKDRIQGIKYD